MMLLDNFMPVYDFDEKHETTVRASAEKIYAALNSLDFNESSVIRRLTWLRGLSSENLCGATVESLTLLDVTKFNFVVLGEKPNEEILLGLIGKFWSLKGDLQRVTPEDFLAFDKNGYAKAAWNFTLKESADREIFLKTETRVQCLGEKSQESFRFYWRFIKPFSGWIRQEMLRLVKRKAEAAS